MGPTDEGVTRRACPLPSSTPGAVGMPDGRSMIASCQGRVCRVTLTACAAVALLELEICDTHFRVLTGRNLVPQTSPYAAKFMLLRVC